MFERVRFDKCTFFLGVVVNGDACLYLLNYMSISYSFFPCNCWWSTNYQFVAQYQRRRYILPPTQRIYNLSFVYGYRCVDVYICVWQYYNQPAPYSNYQIVFWKNDKVFILHVETKIIWRKQNISPFLSLARLTIRSNFLFSDS